MNMRTLPIAAIVAAFVFALTGSALAQKTKSITVTRPPVVREMNPNFKGKPEQEIEALEHQMADALRLSDAAKLDALLSDTVLVASLIADKKVFIAYLKALNIRYYSIERSGMRIQMYGDTAIATGIQRADIDIEGGSRMTQTIFMNTWKKIDGVWRCVAYVN